MTIRFTEEEWANIDKTPFNWSVSPNCPERIRVKLSEKLKLFDRMLIHDNEITTLSDERSYIYERGSKHGLRTQKPSDGR